jgi:hypothetical protein
LASDVGDRLGRYDDDCHVNRVRDVEDRGEGADALDR